MNSYKPSPGSGSSPPNSGLPRAGYQPIPHHAVQYQPTSQNAAQYHTMPITHQSQMSPGYGERHYSAPRPPLPEPHAGDGFQPLAPGTQPVSAEPKARSMVIDGIRYALLVVQQPQRARMCGFGDKDRRPITPPPCVKLVMTDAKTGKEIDVNDVDYTMFVLNVDLWSECGTREVNLVRHSTASPAASVASAVSYGQVNESHIAAFSNVPPPHRDLKYEPSQSPGYPGSSFGNPYQQPPSVAPYAQYQSPPQHYGGAVAYHQPSGYAPSNNSPQGFYPQNGYNQPPQNQHQMHYTSGAGIHAQGNGPLRSEYVPFQSVATEIPSQRTPISSTTPTGMFTRNLIGSLAASAFRLTDPVDKIGIWFVLQDLSVRTEGTFRLRFSFVNVGVPGNVSPQDRPSPQSSSAVNTGKAPILAACFSDPFTVYSAKRFPGVVESTELSRCFATQGIKIPIRKDAQAKGEKNTEYDED